MPAESRFRLERPFDIAEAFSQRRSGSVSILVDERREVVGSRVRMPRAVVGEENRRRGRAPSSVLPSWYPRTPLRDITAITRAIERRRARLGEENWEAAGGLVPSPQVRDASHEHEVPATPSTIKKRPCPPPSVREVHKILLEVANQPDEGEPLTPQKKLLNSIDQVEKVVMEELQRLKTTPSAKKAEREKRVRTLMSMR